MSDISAASSLSAALRQGTSTSAHASYAASRHGTLSSQAVAETAKSGAVQFSADGGLSATSARSGSTITQILDFLA